MKYLSAFHPWTASEHVVRVSDGEPAWGTLGIHLSQVTHLEVSQVMIGLSCIHTS